MSGSFLDSSILVYLLDERDAAKRDIAERLVRQGLERRDAAISFQVVQEALNVITGKLPVSLTGRDAGRFFDRFLAPLWRVMPTADLYRDALRIQEQYGYGFYDSLIVSAALDGGCDRLYSEDLQHGQRIERLTIINPFRR